MTNQQRGEQVRREMPFIRARRRLYTIVPGGVARWQAERERKRRTRRKAKLREVNKCLKSA